MSASASLALTRALEEAVPAVSVAPPDQRESGFSFLRLPALSRRGHVLLIFLFSGLLAFGSFALNGNYGINLADEGFLWYGSRVVMEGQVPLRDFQSYDPGRYYWVGGWSLLFGDGLLAMRTACALFQVLGVGCGLLALYEAGLSRRRIALAGILVTLWMLERFKLYEQCLSLMALLTAVRLIRRPDWRNALVAGTFVGFAAFMGRNHGMYCAVGFAAVFGFLAWKHRHLRPLLRPAGAWIGGVVLGYAPMLIMLAFVPGFWAAFVESLHALARNGSTNLKIPVPWPWTLAPAENSSTLLLWTAMAEGWCFVMLLAGFAGAAVAAACVPLARLRENAALVAGCAFGIPYAHYAFSRADAPHLCHSMPLLVVTLLAVGPAAFSMASRQWWRATISVTAGFVATGLTVLGTLAYSPLMTSAYPSEKPPVEYEMDGETFRFDRSMVAFLNGLKFFDQKFILPGENLLIAPYSPTLYNVLHRRSPLWEIYFLWPPSPAKQREMTRELEEKNVRWVLLQDVGLDGRADRRLTATHPVFVDYLRQHYSPVVDFPLPARYHLFRRNGSVPPPTPVP